MSCVCFLLNQEASAAGLGSGPGAMGRTQQPMLIGVGLQVPHVTSRVPWHQRHAGCVRQDAYSPQPDWECSVDPPPLPASVPPCPSAVGAVISSSILTPSRAYHSSVLRARYPAGAAPPVCWRPASSCGCSREPLLCWPQGAVHLRPPPHPAQGAVRVLKAERGSCHLQAAQQQAALPPNRPYLMVRAWTRLLGPGHRIAACDSDRPDNPDRTPPWSWLESLQASLNCHLRHSSSGLTQWQTDCCLSSANTPHPSAAHACAPGLHTAQNNTLSKRACKGDGTLSGTQQRSAMMAVFACQPGVGCCFKARHLALHNRQQYFPAEAAQITPSCPHPPPPLAKTTAERV